MENTKSVKVEWNGKTHDITIRKLTYGEQNEIQSKALTIEQIGSTMKRKIDLKALKELSLVRGISNAPFNTDIESIRNLDSKTGNKLFEAVDEFNNLTAGKKAGLQRPSATGQPTKN